MKMPLRRSLVKASLVALLTSLGLAAAGDAPVIDYTKVFPNSSPPYAGVELKRDGSATYKESADDQNPAHFQLSQADTDAIFGLADKLNHFKQPLESNLKVAFMGMKTFRYVDGTDTGEAKFNYSLDDNARAIADWFDRIIETELRYEDLERTARFDKLGVDRALLNLEISVDKKRLVAQERFLPLLDRIAKNESYLHMARERAARLAASFRGEGPKVEK